MRKLRIFFVELILVGIFVGWLLLKYPTTIDTVIPWIALAILWHLTWETVLQTEYVKARAAIAQKRLGNMAWIIVFCAGGCISIGYWYSIRYGLAHLADAVNHPASTQTANVSPAPAAELPPAGFITFVGQVLNGYAPMMQVNQTDTPLDDVHLSITQSLPNSDSDSKPAPVGWQKEIDIGTSRARLTIGMPERFPVGGQKRIRI